MSPARYPRPVAPPEGVRRVQELYRTQYQVELTEEEARTLLEGVMQFIYLTQIHDALHSLRSKVE